MTSVYEFDGDTVHNKEDNLKSYCIYFGDEELRQYIEHIQHSTLVTTEKMTQREENMQTDQGRACLALDGSREENPEFIF